MRAFFDTNVYISTFFKKLLPREEFERFFTLYEIVVCPIVKHELLLGTIHPKTRKELEAFFDQCPVLDAPDRHLWEEMTDLMRKLKWKENRQQNDLLIALTSKHANATLITYDHHFEDIAKIFHFDFILLQES